jgi:hypothetical protein
MGLGGAGTKINANNIYYTQLYNTTSTTLTDTSKVIQTYNGTTLVSTLPVVSATNVGIQFVITNTNGGPMTVNSSSSQNIYSSTGAASATTRALATGHSHIFTAIQSGASAYGWSMV